jgi:hypothetical protein
MEPLAVMHCPRCRKDVQYHYEPINHGKQCLLTLITFGMWLPMWLCLTFSPTKMCNECGGPLWNDRA